MAANTHDRRVAVDRDAIAELARLPAVRAVLFACCSSAWIAGCAPGGTSSTMDAGDDPPPADAAAHDAAPHDDATARRDASPPGPDAGAADAGRDPTPPDGGPKFVWPFPAWVAANDFYASGTSHSGSADLSIQLYTPVRPARHGVVDAKRFSVSGGHGVRLRHEGEDGTVYTTYYGHLADETPVEEGQEVGIDTVLGYVGRIGNANFSGPHVHFTLSRVNDEGSRVRVVIPGLEIGDWVDRGDEIPGDYEELGPTWWPEEAFEVRVVDDVMRMYETTGRSGDGRIRELSRGTILHVLETERGQYRVEAGGESGWVAHSGTIPVDSPVFDIRVTASTSANVRQTPTTTEENRIGSLADGLQLTGYERGGAGDDWIRVLWPCNDETNRSSDDADSGEAIGGCPSVDADGPTIFKYGWMGPAVTEEAGVFHARTRIDDLNVYRNRVVGGENQPDCPCNSDSKIGEIEGIRRLLTVSDTRNGWYRIDFDGRIGWVRGWLTSSRQ